MPVDLYASEPHYLAHLAPVWAALGDLRGDGWVPHGLLGRAAAEGVAAGEERNHPGPPPGDRPCLVASFKDHRLAHGAGRPTIYLEHGAGQAYPGDEVSRGFPGYSGGREHDGTLLFLTPGEEPAERWRAAYPDVPAVAVGCPRLDGRHSRLMNHESRIERESDAEDRGGPRIEPKSNLNRAQDARKRASDAARARGLAGATVAVSFHFDCLPGDVQVSGPATKLAGSRWYEGPLVVVRTAAGYELPVTPNHPILTPSGWVKAGDLREGDEIVSGRRREGMKLRVGPDDVDVPSTIKEVASAARQAGSVIPVAMPHTAEDLDCEDRINGEVYVVSPGSLLGGHAHTALRQPIPELSLAGPDLERVTFASDCPFGEFVLRARISQHCVPDTLHELLALGGGHSRPPLPSSRTQRDFDSGLSYPSDDRGLCDAVEFCEISSSCTSEIRGSNLADIWSLAKHVGTPSLTFGPEQPAVLKQSDNSLLGLSEFVGDAAGRHAIQISTDHVVGITRQFFAGHVYDLQTTDGWFLANNLVVHNCGLVQETRSAWWHWEPDLRPVVAALRAAGAHVLGHAHPRLWRHVAASWRRAGAEPVAELDEVLDRADAFAADNTSALPEAASCGIPLVWIDHPHYRRDVWHGGRFFDWPRGQVSCGEPALLPAALGLALADPPEVRAARDAMVRSVYVATDGHAAERAAAAIYSALA